MDFNFWDTLYKIFGNTESSSPYAWILYLAVFIFACFVIFVIVANIIALSWERWGWLVFFRMQEKIISRRTIYNLFCEFFSFASFIYLSYKIYWLESGDGMIDDIRHIAFAFLVVVFVFFFIALVRVKLLRSEIDNSLNNRALLWMVDKLSINSGESETAIDARIDALHLLQKVAYHSIDHNIKVMKFLCDYIRKNSPNNDEADTTKPMGKDIEVALSIIRFREPFLPIKNYIEMEQERRYYIDLSQCNLQNQSFWFDMRNMNLNGANLQKTCFRNADITGVKFDNADVLGANMERVYAHECDFSKCKNLTQEQLNKMYCGINVIIPDDLKRPEHWPIKKLSYNKFKKAIKNR